MYLYALHSFVFWGFRGRLLARLSGPGAVDYGVTP